MDGILFYPYLCTKRNIRAMNNIKSVCVYSASSTELDKAYLEAATCLGKVLAERRLTLINGAGRTGLMGAASDAALAAGGRVVGIIPQFMVDRGWHHPQLTELIVTQSMHERKELMAEKSDGIIAMPGGCGTLEELMEIITWKQLGIYRKPIVILNTRGYYNSLINMLDTAIAERFMRQEHHRIWQVASSPEEAVELLFNSENWNRDPDSLATI